MSQRLHRRAIARPLARLVAAVSAALLLVAQAAQAGFDTRATSAYVVDLNTGIVLLEKNADVPLPPASMSKLMTLLMMFEAIEDGRIDIDTTFTVSTRARQMGGSRMFVEERHRPTAEDLIRGIAVLSGNDASVVVAEGLAGTEDAFARMATERARALGMRDTTIANASGWPHPDHRMSMRDLAILASHIITEHPRYYPYLAEEAFTWNDITQSNRVPLLTAGVGLDGLKTGFTSEAGYGLTGSARQAGRRIVFVISGLGSERERAEEAERIMNWAFRQFVQRDIAAEGEVLASADVWMGDARSVPLVAAQDVRILVPAGAGDQVAAQAVWNGPLEAPLAHGQPVGELRVSVPGLPDVTVPLLAGADVAPGGFVVRMRTAANVVLGQVLGRPAVF